MRPGQSCPGVVRWAWDREAPAMIGFNEAGAIMPRSGVRGKNIAASSYYLLQ